MKALIVEDEKMAQNNLARNISENCRDIEIVGFTSSVKDTIAWLEDASHHAEIIFMDVELEDGNCFEIFRQVEIHAKVIMTTAYDSYALKAFEAGSVDYLLKPIDPDALKRAVSRCTDSVYSIQLKQFLDSYRIDGKKKYKDRFIIRYNTKLIPIRTSDIAYFFAENRINYLMTTYNEKYMIDDTLDDVFDAMDPEQFFKVSRSCIISLKAIKCANKKLSGNIQIIAEPASSFDITVSRANAKEFLHWFTK